MRNNDVIPQRSIVVMATAYLLWIVGTVMAVYELSSTQPALAIGLGILSIVIGLRVCWG